MNCSISQQQDATVLLAGASARDDAADLAAEAAASEAEQSVRDVFRVCMDNEQLQVPTAASPPKPTTLIDEPGAPSATEASASEHPDSNRDALFPALPGTATPHPRTSAGSPVLQDQNAQRDRGMWGRGGGDSRGGGVHMHVHSDESDHHGGNSQRDHESPVAHYPDDDFTGGEHLQFDFDEAPQTTPGASSSRGGDHRRVSDAGWPLAGTIRGSGGPEGLHNPGTGGPNTPGIFARSQQGAVASDSGYSGGISGGFSSVMTTVSGAAPPLHGQMSPVIGSMDESIQLLGSSPHAGVSVNQMSGGDYFMYQVWDGSWLFLHPINVCISSQVFLLVLLCNLNSFQA